MYLGEGLLVKLSKKLYWVISGVLVCLGFLLYFTESSLFQTQDKVPKIIQNNSLILQEAKKTFLEGIKASDTKLVYQAIDKYSAWLKINSNNPDKKLVADVFRSRASAFITLNTLHQDTLNKAIRDYEKSIQYDPVGEVQFGICLIEKQQGNLSALHDCYVKAADLFLLKKVPKDNFNFLIARILSGDKPAIIEYRNIFRTLTGDKKELYEMAAKEYFDKATYEEIIK